MPARRTAGLFLTATLAFGTGFVGIKAGLVALPPLFFAGLRYDVGAVAVLGYAAARGTDLRPRGGRNWLAVVVGAVFLLGLNGGFLFLGVRSVTSGTAAVMYSLAPVIAPLVGLVVLPDSRLVRADVAGLLLGLGGVVVVAGLGAASTVGPGTGFLVGAAASVAVGSVLLRRLEPSLGRLPLTGWGMVLAAVGLHLVSVGAGEPQAVPVARRTLLAVLWVGGVSTAVAFPAYFGLIAVAGPVRANLITYAVPLVATLTGVALLGESVPVRTGVGFLVIAAGFALVERDNLVGEYRRLRGLPADPPPETHPCESIPRG